MSTSLKERTWSEVRVRIPLALEQPTSDVLFAAGSTGTSQDDLGDGWVLLHAYFDEDGATAAEKALENTWKEITPSLPFAEHVSVAKVEYENWAENWKQFFKPVRVGERMIVTPSWEEAPAEENDVVIRIDPGLAFGSGTHATTQIAMALTERVVADQSPGTLLDVGTGTGIIAIAASKLGVSTVRAVDNDIDAVRATEQNLALNPDACVKADDTAAGSIDAQFDVVVANIIAAVLVPLAPDICARARNRIVLSGIKPEHAADVTSVYEELGWTSVDTMTDSDGDEDWVGFVLAPTS